MWDCVPSPIHTNTQEMLAAVVNAEEKERAGHERERDGGEAAHLCRYEGAPACSRGIKA